MTDYTAEEVAVAIKAEHPRCDWESLVSLLGYDSSRVVIHDVTLRGARVPIVKVDEDDGDEWGYETFVILRVGTQLFKKSGHYTSHYGDDWLGPMTEVSPREITTTVYEEKSV